MDFSVFFDETHSRYMRYVNFSPQACWTPCIGQSNFPISYCHVLEYDSKTLPLSDRHWPVQLIYSAPGRLNIQML